MLWLLSLSNFVMNISLIIGLYWFVIFSEPWDTNGIVILFAWLVVPLFTLPFTLPSYYLLRRLAKSKGVWPNV